MVPVLRLIMFWNGLHLVLQGCLLPALREDVVPILPWPLLPMKDLHKRYQKNSKDYKRTHTIQYLPNFSSIESSPLGSNMCPMVPVLRLIFCWIGVLLLQG